MIYYVNAHASRDGNGSKAMPFRHIDDAARVAVAGDEVIVAPGIYGSTSIPGMQVPRKSASCTGRKSLWARSSPARRC